MSTDGFTLEDSASPAAKGGDLPGLLAGVRVVEVEPPEGSSSRRLAPFYGDEPDPERSLFFWTYNRGKRSIALDTAGADERARLEQLIADADIVLESGPRSDLAHRGLDSDHLLAEHPGLILA